MAVDVGVEASIMNRRSFLSTLGLTALAPAAIARAASAPPDCLFVFTYDAQGKVTSMTGRGGYVIGIDPARSDRGDHHSWVTLRSDGQGWHIVSTSPLST